MSIFDEINILWDDFQMDINDTITNLKKHQSQ